MTETWYANAAVGSEDWESHVLAPPDADPPRRNRISLCGHRYRNWQAVEEFARPEVFTRCATCLRRSRAGRPTSPLGGVR